jgi:hypothetical protein
MNVVVVTAAISNRPSGLIGSPAVSLEVSF